MSRVVRDDDDTANDDDTTDTADDADAPRVHESDVSARALCLAGPRRRDAARESEGRALFAAASLQIETRRARRLRRAHTLSVGE